MDDISNACFMIQIEESYLFLNSSRAPTIIELFEVEEVRYASRE
jgi:hypothetical protein